MKGKIPLSLHFKEHKVYEAITMAVGLGLPVYVYTTPIVYDPSLGEEIIRYNGGPRYRCGLESEEIDRLEQQDLGYYQMKPHALQLIGLYHLEELGRTSVMFNDDYSAFSASFTPYCNILYDHENEERGLVLNELYKAERLFVNLSDLQILLEAVGMPKSFNLNGLSKRLENSSSQQSANGYTPSQAGENIRDTHEGIIQYFIEAIETDFQSDQLRENSIFLKFLTKDGKFQNDPFSRELNEHAERLFGGEKGFKPDSLKKRLREIRQKFR